VGHADEAGGLQRISEHTSAFASFDVRLIPTFQARMTSIRIQIL